MWRDDQPQIFRGSNYDYRLQPSYPGPGPVTSNQEIMDLTIAVLALAAMFSMSALTAAAFGKLNVLIAMIVFVLSLLAVMLGVFTHELAHKFVARSYGYWAEFRRSDTWLSIGLFMSIVGFGFIAAPGAVMIRGDVTTDNNGKISAAGPMTNAIIGFAFFPVAFLLGPNSTFGYIATTIVIVSTFLGTFNMLPIFPFDGSKVWRWSAAVYLGMVAMFGTLIFLDIRYLGLLG